MLNKIWIFFIVICAVLNLVFDLISPPVHLYRNLIEGDIGFIIMTIAFVLMWRQANGR